MISALVPNLLLVLLVVRTISRPLQKITLAAVDVTNGKYGTEVDLRRSNDEIGLLADSFNEMSRKMAEDIDKLKRMNEQLMRADRLAAMGTLAAGVAHEVNNPLASISSLIQMIGSRSDLDDETREQLDVIASQIERIKGVTKGLTDFSRARPAARQTVRLESVVRAALRLAEYDSTFQKLRTSVSIPPDIPQIAADPDQLQQVFLNLFLNARDAMPMGGELSVWAELKDDLVRITVRDNGPGLDELVAKKAFDPFYTTKSGANGTGLGLAICYGIVTAHGGSIEFERTDGDGATVALTLPVSTAIN